jgi:TRAP-type C4-dicarboxylate transport system substrate-binding protein
MKKTILTFVVAASVTADVAPAGAQETIKLTVAAGHPPVFLWVKHLKESLISTVDAELAKTGKYKIAWTEAYGGTLAKLGSELETMQQGISDLGMAGVIFHSAALPLNNVTYFVPFGPTDVTTVTKVIDGLQDMPELKAEWTKYNIVYLAGLVIDSYGIVGKPSLAGFADLPGKRIAGAGANLNWIKGTGAVGVQGHLAAYYNDIKNGVYDGALTFATAAVPGKLFEVAPNYLMLDFGAMYATSVGINKNRWDRLPPEVKAAISKGASVYKARYLGEQNARLADSTAAWEKSGGKFIRLTPEQRAMLVKQVPNPTKEWAKQAGEARAKKVLSAYMNAVRETGYRFPRDYDKE